MMNEIKELNFTNNKQFIIEITLILIESQKKITISLFISAPITVLQLKEFISKDFDFDIQNMIFFYPPKGIIDNTYKFQAESNEKICLDLILDDKNTNLNILNNEKNIKNYELQKLKNKIGRAARVFHDRCGGRRAAGQPPSPIMPSTNYQLPTDKENKQ